MIWYRTVSEISLLAGCLAACWHLVKYFRSGAPRDFSRRRGDTASAVFYSFTGAMNPAKKESALLHLPTYTAGVLYHLGTFASLLLYALFLLHLEPRGIVLWGFASLLCASSLSGAGMLVKRIAVRRLRSLSTPDDFVSNMLVTLFQLFSLGMLTGTSCAPEYYLTVSALLLYAPAGKLKHALYFFAARYQLGVFNGWRGVWPAGKY